MKKTKNFSIENLVDGKTGHLKCSVVTSKEQADAVFYELVSGMMANKKIRNTLANMPDKKEVFKARLKKTDKEVSDEEFFDDIEKNPLLLGSRYAQEKIHRWQQERQSNDRLVADRAEEKLVKIGATLAYKGRPKGVPKNIVAIMRDGIYRQLKDKKILNGRSVGVIRLTLKKLFGKEIIDSIYVLPSTYSEMADEITARAVGLTSATVERYCKDTEKLRFKSATAFVEKPAKKPSRRK